MRRLKSKVSKLTKENEELHAQVALQAHELEQLRAEKARWLASRDPGVL